MNKKVSVVIRNKNEAGALENVLSILNRLYLGEIKEIIVVDNQSTDMSTSIAKRLGCKVITIENFSYGRAINLGIEAASSVYVLLLSAHAIPVGNSFFKNSIVALEKSETIAGIRYINSIDNYNRALQNDFVVKDPLRFGLMAGCCMVNKKVWEQFKFNEELVFSEDKEWSQRVVENGFDILDFNETFFYFINRQQKSILERYKNETIAEYQLHNKDYPSPARSVLSFCKKNLVTNPLEFLKIVKNDLLILKTKLEIHKTLKRKN